ncbi:hypothetical protein [Sphingomonas hengshuiensis]|uniref:hypothetical protein n=1 Tax=Sphingomonas hengshuiensis TaxID=1609977 RepID=UPI0012B95D52|nr:hypothetical protein [Sphingomonas hengshuiensis]
MSDHTDAELTGMAISNLVSALTVALLPVGGNSQAITAFLNTFATMNEQLPPGPLRQKLDRCVAMHRDILARVPS